MLYNRPAQYKDTYPFLKDIDSLILSQYPTQFRKKPLECSLVEKTCLISLKQDDRLISLIISY